MELQRTRVILLLTLGFITALLFNNWQQEQTPVVVKEQVASISDVPMEAPRVDSKPVISSVSAASGSPSQWVLIETDTIRASISPVGGDLVRVELKNYHQTQENPDTGVYLLDSSTERFYVAQSGLIGEDGRGPDSVNARAPYKVGQQEYRLGDADTLSVPLTLVDETGRKFTKTYHFKRGSYFVGVDFTIDNPTGEPWQGSFYGQAKRQWSKTKSSSMIGAQMYEGAAFYTPDKPYKKVSYSDLVEKGFSQKITGGWGAFLEHYFLCAWIPDAQSEQHYYSQADKAENLYKIGSVSSVLVPAGEQKTISAQWYVGPEITDNLKGVAPGLELTIDYGILWPISMLLFSVLKFIHQFVGNWGWSIITLTFLIKLAFYKLSATSYRSMGRMRQLQPKVEAIKQQHDDKQKQSQAMLELYRKEKVNPLGGCLPILIQIPIFIAFYYVLLESVELRHAPFMLWITDLSVKDPFYVLPVIMGASMLIQQKMNPTPPDPIQAKVMMAMPVVFTVLFLQFPAGLVLYWVVNNILSIVQQWYITRRLPSS